MYGFPYIENGSFFISGHPCTGDPRKEVNYLSASTSPLPYTGNKSCIVNTILTVMPKHSVYIEPCMGSAEVFFRKPKAEREILNDYNGDLVNLFRTIQSNKKLVFLLGRLYLSINSELIFRQNKERLRNIPNVLPPQPLGKPRHLRMARLFSCVFRLSMQTEGFRLRREQTVLFGQQTVSGTDLCQRCRQRAVSEDSGGQQKVERLFVSLIS